MWISSPHQDQRPVGTVIDLLILHAISLPSGRFASAPIVDLFCGKLLGNDNPLFSDLRTLRVSSHYLIDRQGRIIQFVADQCRAWHAGESLWQGRSRCNDFSIGIELIGDQRSPFTLPQYHAAALLSQYLMQHYPGITAERIVGHADVAPGRKWDPGVQWNWHRFRQILKEKNSFSACLPKQGHHR